MVLEEDDDDADSDANHNIEEENTAATVFDVPMIDTIVDTFSSTIDLNSHQLNTISPAITQANSASKKAHSKVDRNIFKKVGGKLRLKPLTTLKSLKFRPLRYSSIQNRKVKVIDKKI